MGSNTYNDVMRIGIYQINIWGSNVLLTDVLYVLIMRRNLVLVSTLTNKGFEVYFIPGKVIMEKHGWFVFDGKFLK